jgi:hypothetical protein
LILQKQQKQGGFMNAIFLICNQFKQNVVRSKRQQLFKSIFVALILGMSIGFSDVVVCAGEMEKLLEAVDTGLRQTVKGTECTGDFYGEVSNSTTLDTMCSSVMKKPQCINMEMVHGLMKRYVDISGDLYRIAKARHAATKLTHAIYMQNLTDAVDRIFLAAQELFNKLVKAKSFSLDLYKAYVSVAVKTQHVDAVSQLTLEMLKSGEFNLDDATDMCFSFVDIVGKAGYVKKAEDFLIVAQTIEKRFQIFDVKTILAADRTFQDAQDCFRQKDFGLATYKEYLSVAVKTHHIREAHQLTIDMMKSGGFHMADTIGMLFKFIDVVEQPGYANAAKSFFSEAQTVDSRLMVFDNIEEILKAVRKQ